MSFYQKHLFFCVNQKEGASKCCAGGNNVFLCDYTRKQLKQMERHGLGECRVSSSGCMGRCKMGPCLVIYPDNVWYRCDSVADIDQIIEQHLLENTIVEHLRIDTES